MSLIDILSYVVTAACSGGLSWLFTIRATRREAEATAMEHVQNIYIKLIEDLKTDRAERVNENATLKSEIVEMMDRIKDLEQKVAKNEMLLKLVSPKLCNREKCELRLKMEIDKL